MAKQVPWLRVFVEGVVIVGSILMAFGIDAWWEGKQEAQATHEAIQGLQSDFDDHRNRLARGLTATSLQVDAMEFLFALAGEPSNVIPVERTDTAFRRIVNAITTDPSEGTLDALVISGRLSTIQNDELRGLLSGWNTRMEEVLDDEVVVRDFVRETLVPYLAARGVPLTRVYHAVYDDRPEGLVSPAQASAIYSDVLSDPEFHSLLAYRYNWALGARDAYESAVETLDRITVLIRDESDS